MNYGNPYYIGNTAQQMAAFPYTYQQGVQPMMPQNQPAVQAPAQAPVQQTNSYDFVGKYINSYEEVKNAPFVDNTMIYLDTEHDRIYIKKINDDGVPQINVLGLTDIQTPMQTQELNLQPNEDLEEQKLNKIINEVNKKIDEKINEIKKEIKVSKSF